MQERVARQERLLPITYMIFAFVFNLFAMAATAQESFDVAVIRPSSAEVKFERNGETKLAYGTLTMRDVTVSTCIQFAYGTQQPLISGPPSLKSTHYDITAKTAPEASNEQVRFMMRTLLRERFRLAFHTEKKEMHVYTLVVAKSGIKMQAAAPDGESFHQNSAIGMVGKSMSMREFAEYMSDAIGAPLTDGTELPGRYDFKIDFTPYVDMEHNDVRPDPIAVSRAALKGELGLDVVPRKEVVDITVVDHVDPPTAN
jgi:uncharacterized protein (TIGR03435 family)